MLVKLWTDWTLYVLLVELKNGTTTLESSLKVYEIIQSRVTIWLNGLISNYQEKQKHFNRKPAQDIFF